jgi:hypothetical protein
MSFLNALRALSQHDRRPNRRPDRRPASTYTGRPSLPAPMDGKRASGLSGGLSSGTGSGGLGGGSGTKAPSGPEAEITKLVGELEARVKKRPTGAVAPMDARELSQRILQIEDAIQKAIADVDRLALLLTTKYGNEKHAFPQALKDGLLSNDQLGRIISYVSALQADLEAARRAHTARVIHESSKAHPKAKQSAGKSDGVPSAHRGPTSGVSWTGGSRGVEAARKTNGIYDQTITRDHVTRSSSRGIGAESSVQLAPTAGGQFSSKDANTYAVAVVSSADRQQAASRVQAPAPTLISSSTTPRFSVGDEVTFKYNGCRLGGTVISYTDDQDTYLIEWTTYVQHKKTTRRFTVRSSDVIGPASRFENTNPNAMFYEGSLIWYHRGSDSFPGKVNKYSDKWSKPGNQQHAYSIYYRDENDHEKFETQAYQTHLQPR